MQDNENEVAQTKEEMTEATMFLCWAVTVSRKTMAMPTKSALEEIVRLLRVTRHDEIIPGRGEPFMYYDGKTTMQFTRPGVPGEFHLTYKLEHVQPFVPLCSNIVPAEKGEGDQCSCGGIYGFNKVIGCTCFISPPCNACIENPLVCLECGEEVNTQ